MSSSQSQLPAANNAADIIPGTWAAIMERRRITKPSRLMFPYIPVERIPEMLRRWYPFGCEGLPPGCVVVEGLELPVFRRRQFEKVIQSRKVIAAKMQADTEVPYRFNFDNGTIDLPPDVQVEDRHRPVKRKRSLSSAPAVHSSARQVVPWRWSPHHTDCKFPSQENVEYMDYMQLRDQLEGRPSMGTSSFGMRLPTRPRERSAAHFERCPRTLCLPLRPSSSRERTQHVREACTGSTGEAQAPQQQQRPPKPPVPLYPWV